MKLNIKKTGQFAAVTLAAVACFFLVAIFSTKNPGSALTAYADNGTNRAIPAESLTFLESMQKANRSLSEALLPTVVTLEVKEKRIVDSADNNGFHWFFFGNPQQEGEDGESAPRREYEAEGLGSGVIIRKTGNTYFILTNQHVAGTASAISVRLYDGREFEGKLVGGDERKDIALVSFETNASDISIAKMGDSSSVQTGDIVFAIGSPLGYISTVTQGIVSAIGRSGGPNNNINDFIQTDAAINQGNSGGPLVNIYGEVVGINSWIASSTGGSQGLGFSIPINNVKKAIDDFISSGKIKYGWLGVSLVSADKELQTDLGITGRNGALISQYYLASPADKGGLLAGDFVIALNGKEVKSVNQLVRDVGDIPAGDTAQFTVIRNGKETTVKVKIEERTDAVVSDSSKMWPGFSPYVITEQVREQYKLSAGQKGVVVTGVQTKSPAAIMGLLSGDIITKVNDKAVSSVAEFYAFLADKGAKEIWFDVIREGQNISTMRYKR